MESVIKPGEGTDPLAPGCHGAELLEMPGMSAASVLLVARQGDVDLASDWAAGMLPPVTANVHLNRAKVLRGRRYQVGVSDGPPSNKGAAMMEQAALFRVRGRIPGPRRQGTGHAARSAGRPTPEVPR